MCFMWLKKNERKITTGDVIHQAIKLNSELRTLRARLIETFLCRRRLSLSFSLYYIMLISQLKPKLMTINKLCTLTHINRFNYIYVHVI